MITKTYDVPTTLEITGFHFENWSVIIGTVCVELDKYNMTPLDLVTVTHAQRAVDNIVANHFNNSRGVTFWGKDGYGYKLEGIKLTPNYQKLSLEIKPVWEVIR